MPEEAEREIRRRGGAIRWRTLKLPDGRYMHVAVTREPGPRGGRTVATGEPKRPKMQAGGLVRSPRDIVDEAIDRYGPFHGIIDEIIGIRLIAAERSLERGPGWYEVALADYRKALDLWERERDDIPAPIRGRLAGALRGLQARLIVIPGLTRPEDRREIPS